MTISKQKERDLVLQTLFAKQFCPLDKDFVLLLVTRHKITKKNAFAILERVETIQKKQKEIEDLIKKNSKSYDFKRITKMELSLLFLLLYEVIEEKLEKGIALSESSRLLKKYSTQPAIAFVSAMIDICLKKTST
jgi:transcription termination factor NusB